MIEIMKKKRIKLSITIDSELYELFQKKIKEEYINKSLLFDKLITEWLKQ
jgi:metal-responsive CopG/Arc/MetJ family transcriptional regulator